MPVLTLHQLQKQSYVVKIIRHRQTPQTLRGQLCDAVVTPSFPGTPWAASSTATLRLLTEITVCMCEKLFLLADPCGLAPSSS